MARTAAKFPETVAAARALRDAEHRVDNKQWLLGDALIKECGAPTNTRAHNASLKKLEQASEVLAADGIYFAASTLRDKRDMSFLYPPEKRVANVCWTAHRAIHNPDLLAKAVADNNGSLTLQQAMAWRQKHDERERAESHITDEDAANDDHDKDEDEDDTVHDDEDEQPTRRRSLIALMESWETAAISAHRKATRLKSEITKRLHELSPEYMATLGRDASKVERKWSEIVGLLKVAEKVDAE